MRVGTPDQHQHSYDRGKLVIEGEQITYWRRVVFSTPQPAKAGMARMAMYRERIDCAKHTYRTLGYLLYAQDGAILDNVYTPDAQAEAVVPETVGDRFETLMCLIVEQDHSSRAPAAAKTPEQLRAEVERLETRLRELKEQLRSAEQGRTAAPAMPAEAR